MPSTYTPIATTTLGSAGTVTFSSIPSTYTDLIITVNGKASGNGQVALRFNGVTNSYSTTTVYGNGSAAGSARETAATYMQLGYLNYFDTTNQAMAICHIMNYANTTTYKTVLCRMDNAALAAGASVGLWRYTNAITSVEVRAAAYDFASGTVVSLYGVKSA